MNFRSRSNLCTENRGMIPFTRNVKSDYKNHGNLKYSYLRFAFFRKTAHMRNEKRFKKRSRQNQISEAYISSPFFSRSPPRKKSKYLNPQSQTKCEEGGVKELHSHSLSENRHVR